MRRNEDLRSLTGLRGAAALYVLVFHYFPFGPGAHFGNPVVRLIDHGYLAVDLFFVLSGFVMAMNYGHFFTAGWSVEAYRRFLGRRLARIYPLYLCATFAGFAFVLLGWLDYVRVAPVGVTFIASLLMIQAWGIAPSFDSPTWSISAEWAAYLCFPMLVVPTLLRRPPAAWLSGAACVLLLVAMASLPAAFKPDYLVHAPLNFNGYWLAFPVWRCLPEFALGILAFRLAGTAAGRRIAASHLAAPIVLLALIVLLTVPHSDVAIVLLVPLLIVTLTAERQLAARLLASPPIERLGVLSYSIYLTHKLLLGLLYWLENHGRAAGIRHAHTLAALACIALTWAIASAAYRYLEVPARRWMRARFEAVPRASVSEPSAIAS